MINFFNWFVKITGWLVQLIVFRTKVFYVDKAKQSRKIKGPAIIVSNHTSVWDYAIWLFVFFSRTLRFQMAEVLYKKKVLGLFLKMMGGIYVNRETHDLSFIDKSNEILRKGGVVGIFPESRLPLPEEERPLPFKESVTQLALLSEKVIIPVYTSGVYFKKSRVRVMIGNPINVSDYIDESLSEKENIDRITKLLREKIIELGQKLDEQR
ncbi:MAG: 1-acyl-sn-glycerol-3-phosphate acyltransferase [Bacilli bacterium]|nr:1-acyl-sn-glycerol-3-phosphate acyltransferase [Bacilli bacterium]